VYPAMNNTKWEELRLAMYSLGDLSPQWRTRVMYTGYESSWDGEWFYHFRGGGYDDIEWVEIKVRSAEQSDAVLNALRPIHVPGEKTPEGFKVYGYLPDGQGCEYL